MYPDTRFVQLHLTSEGGSLGSPSGQPTFIKCDLHDDAVLGTRSGALVAISLLTPWGDGCSPAGVGVGGAGAAGEGGGGTGGQAGTAQAGSDCQRHHTFFQLLLEENQTNKT